MPAETELRALFCRELRYRDRGPETLDERRAQCFSERIKCDKRSLKNAGMSMVMHMLRITIHFITLRLVVAHQYRAFVTQYFHQKKRL